MGRPLPSRFFGNRNTNSASTTADDGLSGEGLFSVGINAPGSYTTRPTLAIGAPDLPAGVQAVGTVTSEVLSVTTVGGTQTGYTVGQLVTVDGTDAVLRVATIGGTGGDDALTFDFTGGSRGTFTTLPSGAQTTTSDGAGAGLTVVLAFRAKAVVITESGSGYTAAPTVTSGGSATYNAITLTTPDGIVTDSNGYNFATIKVTAQTTSGGSALTGDIVAQKGSRRYRVATTDGTAVCSLVAASPAVNQMSLIATDYSGNTYYVTKLTRHRVLLTQNTGSTYEFDTGSSAAWTLDTLVAGDTGITVQLANN
jgi:hypothetical protein